VLRFKTYGSESECAIPCTIEPHRPLRCVGETRVEYGEAKLEVGETELKGVDSG